MLDSKLFGGGFRVETTNGHATISMGGLDLMLDVKELMHLHAEIARHIIECNSQLHRKRAGKECTCGAQ